MEAVRVLRKTRQQREARRDPDLHSEKCRHLRSQSVRTQKKRNQRSGRKTLKREAPVKLGEKRCSPNK